jgi:hypothetical protein
VLTPRRRHGWLVLIPLLSLVAGCSGDEEPPWSCSWAGDPAGVTVERLAGTYTGVAADGAPVTLVLSADRRYTAEALATVDWLTGKRIGVDPEGGWRLQVEDQWDIPLLPQDPPAATVMVGNTELEVGGTLDTPVLYDADENADSCESLPNVLRRS